MIECGENFKWLQIKNLKMEAKFFDIDKLQENENFEIIWEYLKFVVHSWRNCCDGSILKRSRYILPVVVVIVVVVDVLMTDSCNGCSKYFCRNPTLRHKAAV